ncbi:LytR/AlgR family response regulator transcription factor [Lunatimonas salinarum]|uniref:LytR/AlgR family response regulator transcription factor n=1 Tax=Lunatimonas salinarum TaxID=1774590 RepID=UPI001ADF0A39|nr:response regulator [Lunatimonas salinarum]
MKNKIIIIEDDPDLAENYSELIEELGYAVLGIFDNAPAVLYFLKGAKPDLILIDIKIKGEFDGIDLAKVIQRDHGVPIIFMTAFSDDRTLEHAFSTKPLNYLVKPISKDSFKTALYLATSSIIPKDVDQRGQRIKVRDKGYITYLFTYEIVALKAEGLYTRLITSNRSTILERKILKELHVELPQDQFIRVHKSHVVNIKYIKSLNSKTLVAGHLTIPIRRGYYNELKSILDNNEYLQ